MSFNPFWLILPFVVLFWLVYGIQTVNVYKTCDGVVQDNSLGWPSCVAEGGRK